LSFAVVLEACKHRLGHAPKRTVEKRVADARPFVGLIVKAHHAFAVETSEKHGEEVVVDARINVKL
jgi:hypothetical protein